MPTPRPAVGWSAVTQHLQQSDPPPGYRPQRASRRRAAGYVAASFLAGYGGAEIVRWLIG